MREIILGTAGHVDHGKTSLVKALTGIDTDRLKEEKERGITIELGFAFLDLECGHRLGIVDVPGHERFVKHMVAGAAGIDLVAFVIAADEGIMPQTREHFEICRLLGVQRGLVIITKKDMVEPEWLELVQDEAREFLSGSFLEEAPMFAVSSITGEGIAEVRAALNQLVAASEFQEAYGPFRLPVDRIFTMKGFGAVVTGTSISGRIKVGEDVVIYPDERPARIRGIQIHGREVQEVEAGNRTAINIQGLDKELIERGDLLASPGCLAPAFIFDAEFHYLAANQKPLKNRTRIRVHLGSAEIMGRIILLDEETLEPGSRANVQLLFERPVGAWPGDRYVVRNYSPVFTIGGGVVFNNAAKKRRRFKEANQEPFRLYHEAEPEALLLLHLRESGFQGLNRQDLAIRTGLFGKRLQKVLNGPLSSRKIVMVDSELMLAAEVWQQLNERLLAVLADFHRDNPLKPGLAKEELRFLLHRDLDRKIFQFVLDGLLKKAALVQDGAAVRLAGHEISLLGDEKDMRQELLAFFRAAALNPPTLKEVMQKFEKFPAKMVREIMDVLQREALLVKISEDLYFEAQVLIDLRQAMVALIERDGEIDAQGFKTLTGLSRKFSIPLLEYFDKIKVTIRVGDKRILRK